MTFVTGVKHSMEPTSFLPARVEDRWLEATDLVGVHVRAPEKVVASYRVPGQYVEMRLPGGPTAFLAVASTPGDAMLEFLIKPSAATAALIALHPGAMLEISEAKGPGYPVEKHRGHDVLLFAVGAGISPIRSLMRYLVHNRAHYAGITLFFGARTRAHVPYHDEVGDWEAAGIQVVRVLSQAEENEAGFARGYVQEALQAHPVQPGQTVAFVCGMPAMVEGVSKELDRRGVPAERIFQNF
jgi:NAD(P)H-flavin reductase